MKLLLALAAGLVIASVAVDALTYRRAMDREMAEWRALRTRRRPCS